MVWRKQACHSLLNKIGKACPPGSPGLLWQHRCCTLPDTWAINQQFIILAINNWDKAYERVFLGGLTCDSHDYYNSDSHLNAVFLPQIDSANYPASDSPEDIQYIGLFNTGAYQDALGGYGGIQHCMTPAPKHIIIYRDEEGELCTKLFAKEQSYKSMLKILGY